MTGTRKFLAALALLLVWMVAASPVRAQERVPESEFDPAMMRIDEKKFLGVKPDHAIQLRDQDGSPFTLGDREGMPLILVLSYFNCDGTCSVVNGDLAKQLADIDGWRIGQNFRVLTVSFDPHDTMETLAKFRQRLALPADWQAGWTMALPAVEDEARRLADSVGFKYYWSAQDRSFIHPGIYVFLSPEGRVVRYLYSTNTRPLDVKLALSDAAGEQVKAGEIVNYAVSLCYSYNFKDGRYKLNIPAFVGAGSLAFGATIFIFSVVAFRKGQRGSRSL